VALNAFRWDASFLYLYDKSGELVYHEVLPEEVQSICAMPRSDGPGDALLVGGNGKVWKYEMVGD
jgi:hypothetical protein